MLLRETFPAGAFECNCTILACGDTKEAVVIDPGGEVERIAEIVATYDLAVRAIIHTHAHLDHIYCTRDVKEAHGGAVCLHRNDAFLYDGFAMQAAMFGWKVRETTPVERWLEHGDTIVMGKRELAVIHTPGHTPGSVCFEVEDPDAGRLLFAGDTLFKRSIGRTDLPGGDGKQLQASIRERLYTRDLDTVVITGHGPSTTLGDEARGNPFVRA
ncbi:MAG: MBL fold metallo-hydrolase [Deltaproteobacteria bacterium]|nr:MBL fold metallo-hydrolase [Deltaproteobacteria bacterium]MDQ3296583.1 MBL fold metallo-hydrolase [Myxococcota bacterium]